MQKNSNYTPIRFHIIGCNHEMKFQFMSDLYIGRQCLMHRFKNKFMIPQGGLEQFVILRTFRHISRFFSILWVNLRTQWLFESGLPCQTLTPDQNLTYIMQTISRITLINLARGRMDREGGCMVERKVKQKSNRYFISFWTCGEGSACACFTSPRDDFTTRTSLPPSGLVHL